MGPMIQQMQTACDACDGTGKITARGVKSVKEKKILELHIEKGSKTGTKIKFDGESDEHPGKLPGDIVFILKEKTHHQFKRRNADLLLQKTITLVEVSGQEGGQGCFFLCVLGVLGVWGGHRYWGTGGGGGGLWVDAAKRDEQEQRTDFCRLLIVFVFSVVDRT